MATKTNNWYVITGGPSSGKTTLLAELGKQGFITVQEAARTVIDDAIAFGKTVEELRADEREFQRMVARKKAEIEAALEHDVPTFFDRGMHDTLAYLESYAYDVEDWEEDLMQQAHYKKVFLLEPLDVYEKDYARTEDASFAQKIHGLLFDAYDKYGMKPILIPKLDVQSRLKMIMDHL